MNYEQRYAEASAHYQAAMRRVAETSPPVGQKFLPDTRVYIDDDLGPRMSHFPAGKLATVKYTYEHAYGSPSAYGEHQYHLDVDGVGEVAWYNESQLSAVLTTTSSSDRSPGDSHTA